MVATALGPFEAGGSEALSPEAERDSFVLADARLRIELVASEPEVTSPVAIAWDEHRHLYVAEMRDYPTGPASGRIRRLTDRDGDGRFETAVTFADHLAFPNGVMPWKDGVLVTAAPDILFFRDTNGDGVADARETWFTGFAEGNQQLRVNGLMLGHDGWIYGANGRSDGEIRRPGEPRTKSLRGHDFRFHPDTLQFETIAGRSQFGHTFDDWGNRFLSWNTIPARHEVIPEPSLLNHPRLSSATVLQDTTPGNDTGQVYPITATPQTFNRESTSHFNALAGLTMYRGQALPRAYYGNLFVGETLRNLVHRRTVRPADTSFETHRADDTKEFLASSDPWFHPVNFATGPDGALYIVDFYREWVEHPGFVPERLRKSVEWQRGSQHGRIWRVVMKNSTSSVVPRLPSNLTGAELVRWLRSANGWQRDTAQRLIVQGPWTNAAPLIRRLAFGSAEPEARVKALWTLHSLGRLSESDRLRALRDHHPRIREVAFATLSETNALPPSIQTVFQRAEPDARVRLQALLAWGRLSPDLIKDWKPKSPSTASIDTWEALATRLAARSNPGLWLKTLLNSAPAVPTSLLRDLAYDEGHRNPSAEAELRDLQVNPADEEVTGRSIAVMAGLLRGSFSGDTSAWTSPAPKLSMTALPPRHAFWIRTAITALDNPNTTTNTRLHAIEILSQFNVRDGLNRLVQALRDPTTTELQVAAASGLDKVQDPDLLGSIFSDWNHYAIPVRRRLMSAAARTRERADALMTALEKGLVDPVEVEASTRQALLSNSINARQERIKRLLQMAGIEDRSAIYRRSLELLPKQGDKARGSIVFDRLCVACHAMHQKGGRVGPDLTGIGTRGKESILLDIIDPSRQLATDFMAYSIRLKNDENILGLLIQETASTVTMRRPNTPDENIARSNIAEIRASGRSLMPDGLEVGLSPQDLADLLEHLGAR